MLYGYPILQDNAQVLLDMQEKYEVNALFIAAVAIQESGGGNSTAGLNRRIQNERGGEYNNIFSIQGSYGGGIKHNAGAGETTWNVYPDYATAIEEFCKLISNPNGYYWGQGKYFVMEIATIPPAYCDAAWGVAVNGHITRLLEKAQIYLTGSSGLIDWEWSGEASEIGAAVVREAFTYLGIPYGAIRNGQKIDCSGLVRDIYNRLNIVKNIYHGSQKQYEDSPVKIFDITKGQPGDLIFFFEIRDGVEIRTSVPHVGIYIGNNEMIHSTSWQNKGCTRDPINRRTFLAFGRYY